MSRNKKAAFEFQSKEDVDRAIEVFWTDSELKDLPRDYVGFNTYIVPEEWREQLFARLATHGITVCVSPVISSVGIRT